MTSFNSLPICSGWLRRSKLIVTLVALSVLTIAPRSEAKIIYTPANVTVHSGHIRIDLNHDGIKDFDIQAAVSAVYCGVGGGVHGVVTATPTTGDAVLVNAGTFLAAALASGVSVGPGLPFDKYQSLMTNFLLSRGCGYYASGNWCSGYIYACGKTAYLGLRFVVNGQTHYGWAYVALSGSIFSGLAVTLKGYAYETIAGRAILTGQTSGM